MEIKILGPGCRNCEKLQANTVEALKEIGMEATIIKVQDPKEIAKYGIMQTPGLVINEKLVSSGRIPAVGSVVEWIRDAAA